MLESEGEILLVFLISRKSSFKFFDHVEVYRHDLDKLNWIKMEKLGDRTLFSELIAACLSRHANCLF